MIIRRVHNPRGWTSLPNAMLEDDSLSWRSRGLLAYLLSRPDGWETDSERLAAIAKEGRDAVRTALSELEDGRYLIRHKKQGVGGRWSTETFVYDHPFDPRENQLEMPVDNSVDKAGDNYPTDA